MVIISWKHFIWTHITCRTHKNQNTWYDLWKQKPTCHRPSRKTAVFKKNVSLTRAQLFSLSYQLTWQCSLLCHTEEIQFLTINTCSWSLNWLCILEPPRTQSVSSPFDFEYKYLKSPNIYALQSVVSDLTLSVTLGLRENHCGLVFLNESPKTMSKAPGKQ